MPGSGFWQRKTGRFGRKNRKPPPVQVPEQIPTTYVTSTTVDPVVNLCFFSRGQVVEPEEPEKDTELFLTHPEHGRRGMKRGKRRKLNMATW